MSQISKCPNVTVILTWWEALVEVSELSYKSLLYSTSIGSYCSSQFQISTFTVGVCSGLWTMGYFLKGMTNRLTARKGWPCLLKRERELILGPNFFNCVVATEKIAGHKLQSEVVLAPGHRQIYKLLVKISSSERMKGGRGGLKSRHMSWRAAPFVLSKGSLVPQRAKLSLVFSSSLSPILSSYFDSAIRASVLMSGKGEKAIHCLDSILASSN